MANMKNDRLYIIWKNMRKRCNTLSIDRNLHELRYLGLTVCKEWDSFDVFKEWAMSNGYQEHLMIDRIKNHLGYSPGNCRWATRSQQNSNRRAYGKSVFRGVYYRKTSAYNNWRAQFVDYSTGYKISKHVGYFNTELEAALAYDATAFENLKSNAKLNFPERFSI